MAVARPLQMTPNVEQPFEAAMPAFEPAFPKNARRTAVMACLKACSTLER